MILPLQMPAVSRGRFSPSRIASLYAGVLPSAQNLCNGTLCACANGLACCTQGQSCTCSPAGVPQCGAFGNPGHKHDHAVVTCYTVKDPNQECDCFKDDP
jgi:hypothetical protein